MRVLHIYKSYFPDTIGGCEYTIKTLTNYTSKFGCDNLLLTLGNCKETTITKRDNLSVITFPASLNIASCPLNFGLMKKFSNYANEADILHFHFPWPFADVCHLLSNCNKPTIVTYHSDIVRQRFLNYLYRPIRNKFLDGIDKIVATSPHYQQSSCVLQKYQAKTNVIPLGICEQDYLPVDNHTLELINNKIGQEFILFLGVLRAYKGLEYLLQAIEGTNIPMVIAGKGPEEQKLKKMAKHLCNVTFIGVVSEQEKNALLTLCRAVVLPSHLRSEAFGVCLLEGMLFGKPLISTELTTGTSFINQHQLTGFVVPPRNVSELRAAIKELYTNRALAEQMGKMARQRYQENFTALKMAEDYFDCYKKIMVNTAKHQM